VIVARRLQRSFADGFIAGEVTVVAQAHMRGWSYADVTREVRANLNDRVPLKQIRNS
jgi:hypothetical protein